MSLFKTKLCHLFLRGKCHRQTCSFAHGDAELRRSSSSSNNASAAAHGRREFRGGDLRERLQRRQSPRAKRFSPGRDSRGRQNRGRSYSRSPVRGRSSRSASPSNSALHRRGRKRLRHDEHPRENSEDPRHSALSIDGSQKAFESLSPDGIDELEEELHEVRAEIDSLNVHLLDYEFALEKKTKDINDLSKRNFEMDLKLHKEHEDYKRLNSKLKKFVKLYLRCSRAQEEVKKAQGRLEKLVDDLPSSDFSRVREDSDVNIVSDGDANHIRGIDMVNTVDGSDLEGCGKEAPLSRGKVKMTMKSSMVENGRCNAEDDSLGGGKSHSRMEEDIVAAKTYDEDLANKARNWDLNALLPSTGLAAHAEDETVENYSDEQNGAVDILSKGNNGISPEAIAEQVKLNGFQVSVAELSQMPLQSLSQYAQCAGEDEEVDVD